MSIPIVPACIPKDEQAVIEACNELTFSRELHLDVVDGDFVESISWPYSPSGEPRAVKRFTDQYTLEVDLMVRNPVPAALAWEQAGADMLVFHIESIDVDSFIAFTKHTSVSVGVSFHGDTSLRTISSYIPYADYVQVMGIYTIGKQGEPFTEDTLEKISFIKKTFPQCMVSVDGSVNQTTIPRLVAAGADRLIVGSAIMGQSNKEEAYQELLRCVHDSL